MGGVAFVISVIMFGLIVDAAVRNIVSGMTILWMLVGSRALFALGAGAVTPASMAMAADLSSREMRLRAISMLTAATSTGAIIGPSVSAFFSGLGLSAPFYIIAAAGMVVVFAPLLVLPDNTHRQTQIDGGSYKHLLKGPVLAISISSILFMCGTYGIFSVVGFFVQDRFQLDPIPAAQGMGLGLMCAAAANVFVQAFLLKRLPGGPKIFVIVGVTFIIISVTNLWFSTTQTMFVISMIFNGLGQGFAMPAINTSLSLAAGPESQGRIAGISTSSQAIAFLLAPASAAAMYQSTNWLPFVIGAIVALLTVVVFTKTKVVDPRYQGK